MSVIYVLIPIAILFTAIAIYLFFWAVKSEQFDDLEKQGMSILFDEESDLNQENNDTSTPKASENSLNQHHSNQHFATKSAINPITSDKPTLKE